MTALSILALVITILVAIIVILVINIYSLVTKLKYVAEAEMWHDLAVTDNLTGLYNRNAYNTQFVNLKENANHKRYIMVLLDIDDFKKINDTQGHLAGDQVLQTVSNVLLEIFPKPQYKNFRIGGDEFSIISEGVSENEVIDRLVTFKKTLETVNIYISVGYAIVKDDFNKAFQNADEMLYADKLHKKVGCEQKQ